MKRLKIKFKHKLAWHLRKLAEWLEPSVLAPRIDAPIFIKGKRFEKQIISLAVRLNPDAPDQYREAQLKKAYEQIGNAAAKQVTGYYECEYDRHILNLYVLAPQND